MQTQKKKVSRDDSVLDKFIYPRNYSLINHIPLNFPIALNTDEVFQKNLIKEERARSHSPKENSKNSISQATNNEKKNGSIEKRGINTEKASKNLDESSDKITYSYINEEKEEHLYVKVKNIDMMEYFFF